MPKKRQLLTYLDGAPSDVQHTKPCQDCPFARKAVAGWLAGETPDACTGDLQACKDSAREREAMERFEQSLAGIKTDLSSIRQILGYRYGTG